MQDLQVKTFRIRDEAGERSLNEFLAGKVVRHWSATFAPDAAASPSIAQAIGEVLKSGGSSDSEEHSDTGTWNVFIAYELRMNEPRHDRQEQPSRSGKQLETRGGRNSERRERPMHDQKPRERMERPEKPPREDYQPQIPEADKPVFEAVRKWRNARAREERVKPFAFFNNRQLEEVVKTKPRDEAALRALVPDMEPPLWERYHNELLGFMEASASVATPSSSNGHAEHALEPAAQEEAAN